MADEKQTFTVAGYKFATKEEAQDAKDELNAIKYLSSKTDGKDPKQVYMLYNQILDKQLFNTPVGIDYLKELQQFLYINKDIPNGAHVTMKNEIAISQEWLWVDNPPYQSFEDVMFGYTIPRDFYSGAGASYCGYPFCGLYPIGGLP